MQSRWCPYKKGEFRHRASPTARQRRWCEDTGWRQPSVSKLRRDAWNRPFPRRRQKELPRQHADCRLPAFRAVRRGISSYLSHPVLWHFKCCGIPSKFIYSPEKPWVTWFPTGKHGTCVNHTFMGKSWTRRYNNKEPSNLMFSILVNEQEVLGMKMCYDYKDSKSWICSHSSLLQIFEGLGIYCLCKIL